MSATGKLWAFCGRGARPGTGRATPASARKGGRAPSPHDLEQLVRYQPSVLKVSVEDMQRAIPESRPTAET
jgi:hypothetical protein